MPHLRPTHIVGIGASADGLAALEEFFKAMSVDSGMAFVLVQHLSPDFRCLMDDLLARYVKMPVQHVESGVELEVNAIYLIPPHQVMTIAAGRLYLQEPGIVLSETAPDGMCGLQLIHQLECA